MKPAMRCEFFIHETPTPLTDDRLKKVVGGLPAVTGFTWSPETRVLGVDYDEARVSPGTLQFILIRAGLPTSPRV